MECACGCLEDRHSQGRGDSKFEGPGVVLGCSGNMCDESRVLGRGAQGGSQAQILSSWAPCEDLHSALRVTGVSEG